MNIKMSEIMDLMQTELNESKSGYILMGSEEQVSRARQKIKKEPMMCQGFEMKNGSEIILLAT